MRKDELLEMIANGENSGIEFKRDDLRPEQLAKEVVALANFQGGKILLGVEDDGTISGIQRERLEEWVMNVIQDRVHPMLLPFYEEVKVDGKAVAIISFPQGVSKPYVAREQGAEKIYIRVGSVSRQASREQQMRLFELGGMLHSELLPVPRTDMACLDDVRLLNYYRDILQDPEIPQNPADWEQRLLGSGFLVRADGRVYCSIAGLVLFGKYPRQYLHQSGIRVFAFAGLDKEYHALLDEVVAGPLVGRWEVSGSSKRLLDAGVVEQLSKTIAPFISQEASEVDPHFRREKSWFYPVDAVRELVVNALAHRDWTRFVDIELGIYADRMEVISPGTLQNSMTIEKMIAGQRSPRNVIIMEVLRDYGYVDSRGMGVRTKVIPLMRQHNGRDPVFELTEDYLKTTLFRSAELAA